MSFASTFGACVERLPYPAFSRRARGSARAPAILAIGDSWFFYPMPGGSLIDGLRNTVADKDHVIHAVGGNGALLREFVAGKHRDALQQSLDEHGPELSAVLMSCGGNDLSDREALLPILREECSGARRVEDCFRQRPVAALIQRVAGYYDTLLDLILRAADVQIVLHDYDNALPTGKPIFFGTAWFKPVFDAVRIPAALQPRCVVHILDQFTAALENIAAQHDDRVVLVHSRGTLHAGEWANELHPTAAGFRKIVDQAWRPVLQRIGIA